MIQESFTTTQEDVTGADDSGQHLHYHMHRGLLKTSVFHTFLSWIGQNHLTQRLCKDKCVWWAVGALAFKISTWEVMAGESL